MAEIVELARRIEHAARAEDWEAVAAHGDAQWRACQALFPLSDRGQDDPHTAQCLAQAIQATVEALETARTARTEVSRQLAALRRGGGALNAYTDVQAG